MNIQFSVDTLAQLITILLHNLEILTMIKINPHVSLYPHTCFSITLVIATQLYTFQRFTSHASLLQLYFFSFDFTYPPFKYLERNK